MSNVIALSRYKESWPEDAVDEDLLARLNIRSAYQPIFSPSHQKLVGFEALVRVDDGAQSLSPAELFGRARTIRQTVQLDSFLLHHHVDNFTGREKPVWLFLNINPDTCTHPMSSLDRLVDQCSNLGISPEKIVLELVETVSENTEALLKFINLAKAKGFRIAIDDFGTGDSNFERLWRMDPTIVKIDRSLLVNAEQHHRARQLLESLVRMIRESGSLVLLEGVENDAQARIALATEADLLQGFLFGRPGIIDDDLANSQEAGRNPWPHQFNPLYRSDGACWSHREYFLNALERPQSINCSRPYVGLPDATRTVTLSTSLTTGASREVFCVDIHPDEIFGGQLCFPATL